MDSPSPGAPTAPPPTSKAKVFVRRLASTVTLWPIVLLALFSTNRIASAYVFMLRVLFLAVTGTIELYGLVEKRNLVCFKRWGILGGILLMVGTFLNLTGKMGTSAEIGGPARVNDFEISFIILFVLGLCLCQFFSK